MFVLNDAELHGQPLVAADRAALGEEAEREVQGLLRHCPAYAPTPLIELPALAGRLELKRLWVKDEGERLRLGSFKALGGTFAVIDHVRSRIAEQTGTMPEPAALFDGTHRDIASAITVACATDGNHGRAVAAGARLVGCGAIIFVARGVAPTRIDAIAALGARTETVGGTYDDAVAAARVASGIYDWHLISDTAWDGFEDVPLRVMQGYTVCTGEAVRQLPELPTHVFLQAGVGGFAASVAAHFAIRLGTSRPTIVIVEPERAACVLESYLAGKPVRIPADRATVMAMLECYQASSVAWRILVRSADAFMTLSEDQPVAAIRLLAEPSCGDAVIRSRESGAAGLAGLCRVAADPGLRSALGLDQRSRVLVFNTEGATDRQPSKAHPS